MNQLGLPISLDSKMLLDNFLGNKQLLEFITQIYVDKTSAEIYVYGAPGQGKTHLLQGAALRALADQQSAMYIDCRNSLPGHVLESIEQLNWISIDNIDAINANQQNLFFDLYNRAKQARVKMLISGTDLPSELGVMKDLKTRLGLATIFQLKPLNDKLTMLVLNNQMIDRNLSIDSKVYEYLFKYYSRDVKVLLTAMGDLDKASLQAKQSITIPFVKKNEFNYESLISWIGEDARDYVWLIFIPIVIFIITAVSNGANLTDGIDGLAAGTSAIIGVTLALFAWVSGNIIFSDYLNIMYIPNTGELTIFIMSFVGALIGFLWYNAYPAQIFMGDTGSLTIGGIIAVIAIAIRKEWLIPILCGIFLMENLSVVMQVGWFKYTKKKFGEGRRIFKMSPLHHHYQKSGFHESKIVTRFWIVGLFLAIITIATLKIR